MRMKSACIGAAMAIAACGVANAAPITGWYVGLEGGASWLEEWDHLNNGAARVASFDTGWAALATVGYAWSNRLRVEFEGGYRDNDLDSYTNAAGVVVPGWDATLSEVTFMANVRYDITLNDKLSLNLGVGAGGDFASADVTRTGVGAASDDDWNFAYQGLAGVDYMVTRRMAISLNYRYLRVLEPDFRFVFPNATVSNWRGAEDVVKNTATLGLRYALYASEPSYVAPPAPPSPPPTSSEPPRQFIVFFGFNKYTLTAEATRVLTEAATAAKQNGTASVLITGHTDTVGTNAYNQRLSVRRANVVRAELVRQGVSNSAITSTGKGETELLVQTDDGVKEPQNRRATVDLN